MDNYTIKPASTFYAKFLVSESDGSIGTAAEEVHGSNDLQPIIDATVEEVEEHGGIAYVYECRAIRKVARGKTKVTTIKVKR